MKPIERRLLVECMRKRSRRINAEECGAIIVLVALLWGLALIALSTHLACQI